MGSSIEKQHLWVMLGFTGRAASWLKSHRAALADHRRNRNHVFMNTRLKIAKLTDATDAAHIEKALEAVPHVSSVRVEPDENQALVEHDGADKSELTTAVKQLGYIATVE